jgi:hypothetical protein
VEFKHSQLSENRGFEFAVYATLINGYSDIEKAGIFGE